MNLGRAVASKVIIKYKSKFEHPLPDEPGAPMMIGSLAPGASYNFHLHVFTEQSKLYENFAPKQPLYFKLTGGVLYRDTATDDTNEQPFCFTTWTKGPPLPISTPFHPCNEYQKDFTIYDDPRP